MEENYDFVEWEEGRIDSIWDWTQVDLTETFGMKGANNAGLTICQRRSRLKDSRLESVFYVCKALNGTRRQGMRSVKREVDMLRKCVHPSILGYKDFSYSGQGLDGMTARLYTEHCAFGDLDQFRFTGKRGHPRLSFQEGAQVFRQLAQALLYIHHGISITEDYLEDDLKLEAALPPESYIVEAAFEPESSSGSRVRDNDWHTILHRDIKPGNVFVYERYPIEVKLGDFGLARLDSDETFTYVGTHDWIAPEQRRSNSNPNGKRHTTFKSDIYSFGLTMAAVLPQIDSAQRQPQRPIAVAQLNNDIRQLVRQCQRRQDTLRPSSIVMLENLQPCSEQKHNGPFRDVFEEHLRHQTPEELWTHEITCRLCRRILKAGGVEYVDLIDQIRGAFSLSSTVTRRFASSFHHSSALMSMSEFTEHEHEMVKQLRAEGEATATAILCTKAVTALPGTIADGKEVASLVLAGVSFKAAIVQIRQPNPNSAPKEHKHEVGDGSEDEDEDEDDSDEDHDDRDEDEDENDDDDEEEEEESDGEPPIGGEHALDHPRANKVKDTPIRKGSLWQPPPPTKSGRSKILATSTHLRFPTHTRMVAHTPQTAKSTIQPKEATSPSGLHAPARTAPGFPLPSADYTTQRKGAAGSSALYSPVRTAPHSPPPGANPTIRPKAATSSSGLPSLARPAPRSKPAGVNSTIQPREAAG